MSTQLFEAIIVVAIITTRLSRGARTARPLLGTSKLLENALLRQASPGSCAYIAARILIAQAQSTIDMTI